MGNERLTATIQDLVEYGREDEWRRQGLPEQDILFSRVSGIDGRDVRVFRDVTRRGFLIVVRCPKVTARAWHGKVAPKPMAVKAKTGTSGVVVARDRMYVSDYDLMSAWRGSGGGFEKIFMSAEGGAAHGPWSPEAQALALELNKTLTSRIQHGCQDDYLSPLNPGVKLSDHFAAFRLGVAEHLADSTACARYYATNRLSWPYDAAGKFVG